MDLYARVNILDQRAVRLPKGDVRDAIALDADPVSRAQGWAEKGATHLHIVDLDAAAYGDYENRPLIKEIIEEVDIPVQVAGGVRSPFEVERLVGYGAWRVVMGTTAIEDQVLFWDLCRAHPGMIAAGLDVRPDEEIAIKGWTADSGVFLEQALIELSSAGVASFLVAEAGRDALAAQTNLNILRRALSLVEEPVIASGGARDLDDLKTQVALEAEGKRLSGVVVGREVTEGRFTMEEASAVLDAS